MKAFLNEMKKGCTVSIRVREDISYKRNMSIFFCPQIPFYQMIENENYSIKDNQSFDTNSIDELAVKIGEVISFLFKNGAKIVRENRTENNHYIEFEL